MNEFLLWLVTCFVAFLGFVYIYYKFTDAKKFINIKFILTYLTCTLLLTLIYYYDITFLGVISYFLLCPIMFYLIKYKNFREFIFYMVIIWIYAVVLDLIAMALASLFIHYYGLKENFYYFEAFMSLCLCLMLFVLAHNNRIKKFTSSLADKVLKIKFFDISLVLFTVFTLIMSVLTFINLKYLNLSMMLIVIVLLTIIMFTVLIKYRMDIVENAKFLKLLKDNNDFYIRKEDDNRVFRHNLNAKLTSIKSVANKKAKILLEELLIDNNKNIRSSHLISIVPYGFSGIIYEKICPYLDLLDIKIDNNINYDIYYVLTPRRYNVLVEKLIVALDNAIEACQSSEDKVLLISINTSGNSIVIEIENTFSNEINMDNLGNVGYSTKGSRRGLGLFSIFRNNEVSLSVKIHNNLFITKIVAKKNV